MRWTVVPVAIRGMIVAQRRIGNASAAPVRWLEAHERAARWIVWGIWLLGLLIALPAMLADVAVTSR